MGSDRPKLSGRVDEDTYERWHAFAAANRVTVAALLEALGQQLPLDGRLPAWLARAVADAGRVMGARSDRRPKE